MNIISKCIKKYEQKKENNKRIIEIENNSLELFRKWDGMLCCNSKIKLFQGSTLEETEEKYNEFRKSLLNNGRGRLGSLWEIKEPEIKADNGNVVISIRYSIFELRDGVSEENYKSAIEQYDNYHIELETHKIKQLEILGLKELKDLCDFCNIKYPAKAGKPDLALLIIQHMPDAQF